MCLRSFKCIKESKNLNREHSQVLAPLRLPLSFLNILSWLISLASFISHCSFFILFLSASLFGSFFVCLSSCRSPVFFPPFFLYLSLSSSSSPACFYPSLPPSLLSTPSPALHFLLPLSVALSFSASSSLSTLPRSIFSSLSLSLLRIVPGEAVHLGSLAKLEIAGGESTKSPVVR